MATYKIHPNVKLGEQCTIGDHVIIGYPPRGKQPGEIETVIGDRAVIRSHTIIYAGNVIGDDFQTGHMVMLREANRIGSSVSLGSQVVIEHHCEVGNGVRMQGQTGIAEYTTLEDGAWLGPRVITTNVFHPLCPKAKECIMGPTIKRRAIIGANVTIYPRVVIGEFALVGAGCVVMKDIPPHKVVMAKPPRVVADVFELSCPFGLIDKPYHREG
jgi:acetyltransferase-like isoleucine patch superfamily enzyme